MVVLEWRPDGVSIRSMNLSGPIPTSSSSSVQPHGHSKGARSPSLNFGYHQRKWIIVKRTKITFDTDAGPADLAFQRSLEPTGVSYDYLRGINSSATTGASSYMDDYLETRKLANERPQLPS